MMDASHAMNTNSTTNTSLPEKENRPTSFRQEAWETIRFVIIALAIVLPIRFFIAQPFFVSGASMDPTFRNGQYLIVDELSYQLHDPARGDVVIFKYPQNPSEYFIKRVIGLPGETVSINEQGEVTVTNPTTKTKTTLKEPYIAAPQGGYVERTLSNTEYFVMGDNRPKSFDSRMWGPVERNLFVGRAFLRLYPIGDAAVLPGEFKQ